MLETQADDLIKVLERIAIALEKLAKDSEQKMAWQAGYYGPDPEPPEPPADLEELTDEQQELAWSGDF
jgi:hypothetical protein